MILTLMLFAWYHFRHGRLNDSNITIQETTSGPG